MADLKNMLKQGLKNMKESKLVDECVPKSDSDDRYPWGLRLDLNKNSLDTLGLDITDVNIGDEVRLTAKADVIAVRQNKNEYGDDGNLELQITHLSFNADED